MSLKVQFLKCIENLLMEYEKVEKCGIFFKLEREKDPLEIIGVLEFLKYKIENWGNTNIFSYLGCLFNDSTTLIIGSSDQEEAISIIKYVYLSQVIKTEDQMENLIKKFENCRNLEHFLNEEIAEEIKVGYPSDPELEVKLKNHLKKLLQAN